MSSNYDDYSALFGDNVPDDQGGGGAMSQILFRQTPDQRLVADNIRIANRMPAGGGRTAAARLNPLKQEKSDLFSSNPSEETNDAGLPADGSHGSTLNSAKFPDFSDDAELQHYNKIIANQSGDSFFSGLTRDRQTMLDAQNLRDHRLAMLKNDYIEQHPDLFAPQKKDEWHNAPVTDNVWRNGQLFQSGVTKEPVDKPVLKQDADGFEYPVDKEGMIDKQIVGDTSLDTSTPEGLEKSKSLVQDVRTRFQPYQKPAPLHITSGTDEEGNTTIAGVDTATGDVKSKHRIPGMGKKTMDKNIQTTTTADGRVWQVTKDDDGRPMLVPLKTAEGESAAKPTKPASGLAAILADRKKKKDSGAAPAAAADDAKAPTDFGPANGKKEGSTGTMNGKPVVVRNGRIVLAS